MNKNTKIKIWNFVKSVSEIYLNYESYFEKERTKKADIVMPACYFLTPEKEMMPVRISLKPRVLFLIIS